MVERTTLRAQKLIVPPIGWGASGKLFNPTQSQGPRL